MHRIIVAKSFGGPEVVEVATAASVPVGTGMARVRVKAAGVNPIDWKMYSKDDYGGDESKLPLRLGNEASGIVLEVGPDAAGPAGPVAKDDEVIMFRIGGAYADEVTVATAALLPKPRHLSWEQAASLMLSGTTAIHALTAAKVSEGDTVLVHAAAGGVGRLLVQVASALGAKVIGTAAEHDHKVLRSYGVTPILYGDGLGDRVREAAPEGLQAAIDLVGTEEAIAVSRQFVPDDERFVSTVNNKHTKAQKVRVIGLSGPDQGDEIRMAARSQLLKLVKEGKLKVDVAKRLNLGDAAAAHEQAQRGDAGGKVVLMTDDAGSSR